MLATYLRRMRNNNLEISIAGSSCRLQLLLLLLSLLLIYFIYYWVVLLVQPVLRYISALGADYLLIACYLRRDCVVGRCHFNTHLVG